MENPRIAQLKEQIAASEKTLPFADGPNYYNQKKKISVMKYQLAAAENKEAGNECD